MSDQVGRQEAKHQAVPKEIEGKTLAPLPMQEERAPDARGREDETTRTPDLGAAAAFGADEHAYIRDYIALADQKAGSLFAIVAAMLAYLQVQGATRRWISDPRTWHLVDALACFAIVALVTGAVLSLLAVAPRLTGAPHGVVFWNAVAMCASGEDYAEQVIGMDQRRLLRAKLEHCYELAKVCRAKYRVLAAAIWVGGAGLAAAVIYVAQA